MRYLHPYASKRLSDRLTMAHSGLRLEAAACLSMLTALGEGRPVDAAHAVHRSRRFIGSASAYCVGRRTRLWPLLEQLVPATQAELGPLADSAQTLESDLSIVDGALDELSWSLSMEDGDVRTARRIAVDGARSAKILHDSLSLYLGDEELLFRSLFGDLSRRELADTRDALNRSARGPHPWDRAWHAEQEKPLDLARL